MSTVSTAIDERYVREWLSNQTAGRYLSHDADRDEFFLTPEQPFALGSERFFRPGYHGEPGLILDPRARRRPGQA